MTGDLLARLPHRHTVREVAGVSVCTRCGQVQSDTVKHAWEWREWERLARTRIQEGSKQ